MSTDQLAQAIQGLEVSEVSASALRVHISNLAWATTSQGLADFFGSKGLQVVKAEVMADYSGRSKGWGLAEFQNAADADFAIEDCNDAEVDGRVIHVRADRGPGRQDDGDRPPRAFKAAAGGGGGGGGGGGSVAVSGGVHISNLAWATTSESLTAFFAQNGTAPTKVEVMSDYNGRSKGWGLAEFASAADAELAIQDCNDKEVDGRVIHVRADRGSGRQDDGDRPPRARKPRAAAGGKKARRSKEDSKGCRLFVSNLSWQTDWQGLKEHFRQAGEVLYANVLKDMEEQSKGYGVVEFSTPDEAQNAINTLSEQDLDGRNILVRVDREPGDRQNNNEGGY